MPRKSMGGGGFGIGPGLSVAFGIVAVIVILAIFVPMWPILNDNIQYMQDEYQCESVAKLYYNTTTEECYTETPHANVATTSDGYYPIPFSSLMTPGGILTILLVITIFATVVAYFVMSRKR